jgi:hypothetical protein
MNSYVKSPLASLCFACSSVRNRVRVTMSVLTFSFWIGTPLPLEAMMNDWEIVCGK